MRQLAGLLLVGLLIVGCAAPPPAKVVQSDNFITMAGFTKIDRGTPRFAYVARTVPPHHFGHRTADGVTTYYYFDPTICGCAYTGTQQDWENYKQLAADRMHMDATRILERLDLPADTGSG